MSVFDLDTEGQAALAQEAAANPISADQVTPGFFTGVSGAIGKGVMRGGARAYQAFDMASIAPFVLYENATGQQGKYTDEMFKSQDENVDSAIDYWTPQANEVGTAGKVLGGAAEMVLPLMAGGGNPDLMLASAGIGTGKDLVKQGVDAKTATEVGVVQAAATGLGFKLPFLGSTLASRITSGVVGNAGLGVASRAASSAILGDHPAADQFKPLDAESLAIDTIMGAAFGGLAHVTSPRVKPSTIDAALTANNAKHFQHDTAPGLPADWNASIAHQEAMESAINAELKGEPVNVGQTGVQHADFIPRESSPAPEIPVEHQYSPEAQPNLPPELAAIPAGEGLNAGDRMIETNFRQQVQNDPEGMMDAYAKIPDSAGGKILNTDIARELSPDYLKDRTKSAAVHEPASALVKAMYTRMLADAPKPGEEPLVVFSAGGTGAGKTTGLELTGIDRRAQIVYDSNMSSLDSSVKRIDQALAAGKQVQILYTYRDPVEALANGALPRAIRQEKEFGTGRTVPLAEHAKTHTGAADVVRQLADKYANDPRVDIIAVDNSHGKGNAKVSDLSVVPHAKTAHNDLEGKLHETLDQQYEAGQISESIYQGFKGEPPATRQAIQSERIREATSAGSGGSTKPGIDSERLNPTVEAARQAAELSDVPIPTGEFNADGTAKTLTAREMMAQADADLKQAHLDSKAFEAAVTCYLTHGAA